MIGGNLVKLPQALRSTGGPAARAAWQRSARLLGTCTALMASIAIAPPVAARQSADSIWSGGPILTMNDKAMHAEAVAVANGKILAVGARSEVMKFKGPTTQLVDLKGTIADINIAETVKEGKTIFRLEPGARADRGGPDITPLLVALSGHRGTLDEDCSHDAMFQLAAVMASGVAGR